MRGVLVALVVVGLCGSAFAPQVANERVSSERVQTERLALADTPGAWVVEITTTGGFTGRGSGDVAVRADGVTICTTPIRCEAAAVNQAGRIAERLTAMITATWVLSADAGRCSDCITTTLTIRRRGADGAVSTSTYAWNSVGFADVPADVRNVYEAAMSVGQRGR